MRVRPRERFSSRITLTPTLVAEFARAAGDTNPVHHDPAYAAGTRYKRLRGRIQDEHGQTAVGAKGRVLVTERL